jgi:hypothetical protein
MTMCYNRSWTRLGYLRHSTGRRSSRRAASAKRQVYQCRRDVTIEHGIVGQSVMLE